MILAKFQVLVAIRANLFGTLMGGFFVVLGFFCRVDVPILRTCTL